MSFAQQVVAGVTAFQLGVREVPFRQCNCHIRYGSLAGSRNDRESTNRFVVLRLGTCIHLGIGAGWIAVKRGRDHAIEAHVLGEHC